MKKQQKRKHNTNAQQGMWDLLIPLLFVIIVLPWVVHLAIYSCGYAEYEWYAVDDVLADFYCYYKSYFLDVVAIFAAIVLAFRLGLYKEKRKNMKMYLPLLIYGILVIISTIFSVNPQASIQGNFESFESCLVLISYIIISVYAYQIMEYERDYKIIWYAIVGIAAAFSVIGLLQIFGLDLMNFSWMQRLLMSKEEFELYGGSIEDVFAKGQVYLTLYNPNYAGIVLAMLFTVVLVMCVTERHKRKKMGYAILAAMLLILTWYTYARASLLSVVIVLCYMIYLQVKSGRMQIDGKRIAGVFAGVILVLGVFLVLDFTADFRYLSRVFEKNTREPLEYMTTEKDGIHIGYDGISYLLWLEKENLYCKNESTEETIVAAQGEELYLPMEANSKALYMTDQEVSIMLYLADTTLFFVEQEDGYYYKTVSGKLTEMTEVAAADLHGLEYIGSARGYIWSRVIPMLKEYLIIGSGPDTFAEVFPQHDYAGKIVYSDRPDRVIEKAHNDYLTKWIQTGMVSVICIVIFYVMLFWRGKKVYQKEIVFDDMRSRIGFGCYLACVIYMIANFFNDSTLQTSPLFWVFAGIACCSLLECDSN